MIFLLQISTTPPGLIGVSAAVALSYMTIWVQAGPPPVWYAGNLTDILKLSQYTYYIDCARKYGKIFKVPGPSVLLSALVLLPPQRPIIACRIITSASGSYNSKCLMRRALSIACCRSGMGQCPSSSCPMRSWAGR